MLVNNFLPNVVVTLTTLVVKVVAKVVVTLVMHVVNCLPKVVVTASAFVSRVEDPSTHFSSTPSSRPSVLIVLFMIKEHVPLATLHARPRLSIVALIRKEHVPLKALHSRPRLLYMLVPFMVSLVGPRLR